MARIRFPAIAVAVCCGQVPRSMGQGSEGWRHFTCGAVFGPWQATSLDKEEASWLAPKRLPDAVLGERRYDRIPRQTGESLSAHLCLLSR